MKRWIGQLILYGCVVFVLLFFIQGLSDLHAKNKSSKNMETENIEWAFTKANQHPETLLIDTIETAEETIEVAIYSLTHPGIVDALKQANRRGVKIRMIVDRSQSEGKTMAEAIKILGSAGISMKSNQHSGLMHLKMIIVERAVISTGSFNFSKAAATRNDENLMIIRDNQVAKSFSTEFERMWDDDKRFKAIHPIIAN